MGKIFKLRRNSILKIFVYIMAQLLLRRSFNKHVKILDFNLVLLVLIAGKIIVKNVNQHLKVLHKHGHIQIIKI
jgi:hypothetical protein